MERDLIEIVTAINLTTIRVVRHAAVMWISSQDPRAVLRGSAGMQVPASKGLLAANDGN